MIKKKFKIPLYHGEVTIIQCEDVEKEGEKYGMKNLLGFEACVFRDFGKDGYMRYVMMFEEGTTFKIVAHESLHLVNNIFHDRGIIHETDNDEPAAYLLGWVVEKCSKILEIK